MSIVNPWGPTPTTTPYTPTVDIQSWPPAKRRIQPIIGPQVLTLITGDKVTVTPKGEVEIDIGRHTIRMDESIATQLAERLTAAASRARTAAMHYRSAIAAAKGD